MSNQKQELSIEETNALMQSLLEVSSNQVEDLPEFITMHPGYSIFTVDTFELKQTEDGKMFVDLLMSLREPVETVNPEHMEEALAYPQGSLVSARYYGEFGIKKLKQEWLQPIITLVGEEGSIGAFMGEVVGMEVGVSHSLRVDKDDPEKKYFTIRKTLIQAV